MIAKENLIDGAYYIGKCRNATCARWSTKHQKFFHWRSKYGQSFVETIKHPEDDAVYDVFKPLKMLGPNTRGTYTEIPIPP